MLHAITRPTGAELARCELTHLDRSPVDVERACLQHEAYVRALRDLGLRVTELERLPDHPDAVFVEDTALVLPEVAVILRPGAASRRGETASVAEALAPHRELLHLEAPAQMDGGDLIALADLVLVGQTERTNHAALRSLAHLLLPHGYRVKACGVRGVLHLKTACTALDDETLLAHSPAVDLHRAGGLRVVEVPPSEPHGANVVRAGETLLVSAGAPRTVELLDGLGYRVLPVDVSEFARAEGALTCKSLIFEGSD